MRRSFADLADGVSLFDMHTLLSVETVLAAALPADNLSSVTEEEPVETCLVAMKNSRETLCSLAVGMSSDGAAEGNSSETGTSPAAEVRAA